MLAQAWGAGEAGWPAGCKSGARQPRAPCPRSSHHLPAGGQAGGSELLRAYAAMAVVRQAAAALLHHGVRCAHLYLAQSQAELPGLLASVTAARELRAAFQQARRGSEGLWAQRGLGRSLRLLPTSC